MPTGFTTFPGEVFRAPRSWAEAVYPKLTYFNEVDRGGHFAAYRIARRARCSRVSPTH
jgi:hypothetical protein